MEDWGGGVIYLFSFLDGEEGGGGVGLSPLMTGFGITQGPSSVPLNKPPSCDAMIHVYVLYNTSGEKKLGVGRGTVIDS